MLRTLCNSVQLAFLVVFCGCQGVVITGSQTADRTDDGVVLPPWGQGAPSLFVPLAEEYRVRLRKGPDFDVFEVSKRGSDLGGAIYVGSHPQHFHEKTRDVVHLARRMETIGSERLPVFSFQVGENHCQEAILARVYGSSLPPTTRIFVHLVAFGPSLEEIDRLWQVLIQVRPQ